ncbi:hypothetical protein ACHAXR_008214 [Thalassiosira sp. AJA248-18]
MGWNLSHRPIRASNYPSGGAIITDIIHGALIASQSGDKVINVSYSGIAEDIELVKVLGTLVKAAGGLLVYPAVNDDEYLDWDDRDNDDVIVVGATTADVCQYGSTSLYCCQYDQEMIWSSDSAPTSTPTITPTKIPSKAPTYVPSTGPSKAPSEAPTTMNPTSSPTKAPTDVPSTGPSKAPSEAPTTMNPTSSSSPTKAPTDEPSILVPRSLPVKR